MYTISLKRVAALSGIMLGAFALSAWADWAGPQCAPTGCNALAPINAGNESQTKSGALTLGSNMTVNGTGLFTYKAEASNLQLDNFLITPYGISSAFPNTCVGTDSGGYLKFVSCGGGIQKMNWNITQYDISAKGSISLGTHTFCALSAITEFAGGGFVQVYAQNSLLGNWYSTSNIADSNRKAYCLDISTQ